MLLRIISSRRGYCLSQFFNSNVFTCNRFSSVTKSSSLTLPCQQLTNQDSSLCLHLLRQCRSSATLKRTLSHLIANGKLQDESVVEQLFAVCFHLGSMRHALSLIKTVKEPTLSLQNSIIRHLCDYGLYQDLFSAYRQFQSCGCGCDNFTFPFLIKGCAGLSYLQTGKEIHCNVYRYGYENNVVIQTALVDMYAKCGRMNLSCQVFDGMVKRDLVTWNALLSGYSSNALHYEAFEVFRLIQVSGEQPNVSNFATILPVCKQLGAFEACKSIHALGVKCGLSLNESFVPSLISMYSEFGEISTAQALFHMLPEKNVVAWNAMISTFAGSNQFQEAFEIFRLMHKTNIRPNSITLVSILPLCSDLVYAQCNESIHACGVKLGLEHQTSVATALVTMYSKIGNLDAAQSTFQAMPIKNLLSWNSMISCYVHNEFPHMAVEAFHQMQLEGTKPDSVSIITVLSAFSKLGDLQSGKISHAYSLRNGLDINLSVTNALQTLYSDCGHLPNCIKLFLRSSERNVISWNTLISGYLKKGDKDNAIVVSQQMQQHNVKFDVVTIITVLPMFRQSEELPQGMSIHSYAIKIGCIYDVSLINALLSMYCNCGDLKAAKYLFETMSFRTVVSWNALMAGLCLHNLFGQVRNLFERMIMEGYKPNFVTLLTALPMCETVLQGKCLHGYAVRTGSAPESSLTTSLICMYDRFQNISSCFILFGMADKRNVVVWNTMISVCNHRKLMDKAFVCFREMLWVGVEPDLVTILTLVSSCTQLDHLKLSESVSGYIIKKGFDRDISINNALIDMYCRCGDILTAKKVFDLMEKKDVVSWSVMINGYGIHGDGKVALDLFSQMKFHGVQPDDVTFIGVLSACSHAGLVEEGGMVFESMSKEYDMVPRVEHYACMVDLLARWGDLEEAFDLVKRLQCEPSASMLESLLGACKVHGNVELGVKIGKLIGGQKPESSGFYVALSSIYAAAGRWSEAGTLRSTMNEQLLRKIPGFSLIDVNGYCNKFNSA